MILARKNVALLNLLAKNDKNLLMETVTLTNKIKTCHRQWHSMLSIVMLCRYAEFSIFIVIMMRVIVPSVIMLSVIWPKSLCWGRFDEQKFTLAANHRYLRKVDCSSFVLSHATSACSSKRFLQRPLTVLTGQTRQAVRAINQYIFNVMSMARTFGVTKFTIIFAVILVTLCCAA